MKFSIIIPTYTVNQTLVDMTNRCLESIHGIDEILVVDDGSPFRMTSAIGKTIRLSKNEGYAAAVNAGLKQATGDYLIICNNDITFIDPNWLHEILKPLKEGYGISSIRTTEPDGWLTEDKYEDNAKFGSLWAMTRATYQKLGLLDERFAPGYGEDLDYRNRAHQAGIKMTKNHKGLAEHLGKATFKTVDPQDTAFKRFISTYKEKWRDECTVSRLSNHAIVLWDNWDLLAMPEAKRKNFQDHEISLEEIKRILKK